MAPGTTMAPGATLAPGTTMAPGGPAGNGTQTSTETPAYGAGVGADDDDCSFWVCWWWVLLLVLLCCLCLAAVALLAVRRREEHPDEEAEKWNKVFEAQPDEAKMDELELERPEVNEAMATITGSTGTSVQSLLHNEASKESV
eukprot:TRINITY_DN2208_c0_g1_i6.p5 TRINITY_DN2208_c0_g1~~TRINITY_DN2208_c0_g1_i6.p5  ORF type:complete len:143 (+),score=65.59 TRINITY_DN2208_c0_g1_i6:1192-1620(+)